MRDCNGHETVSELYQKKCKCWKNDLIGIEKIELKRGIKPGGVSKTVNIPLHSFSDASELGYGESSYLKLVDEYRHIDSTLMTAKARVTSRRFVSISRLELVTAVSTVKISALIKKELEIKKLTEYIWTNIKIVLGYIAQNKKATINLVNENLRILDISQIQQAGRYIIKLVQSKYFSQEMKKLLINIR